MSESSKASEVNLSVRVAKVMTISALGAKNVPSTILVKAKLHPTAMFSKPENGFIK